MIRFSEPVYPTGGLSGQGILHLLGTPPFSPLALVLREAGQNIWDARKKRNFIHDPLLRMLVRIRTLKASESEALRAIAISGDGGDDELLPKNDLRRLAGEAGNIRVLEICDFGTLGLMGSVDPQEGLSNFTRFFFSFGDTHADGKSGGTYGYGRSSLYLAGNARTIFVDSLTTDCNGSPVRRFMGSRIGDSYERTIDGRNRRFVGRHFWGAQSETGDGILPLTGLEAERHAASLGLPKRGPGETGTSILIPWPVFQDEDENPISGIHIVEILLENFWPKLVRLPGSINPPMEIYVEDEGRTVEIPDASSHPVYGFFCSALTYARTRDGRCCEPVRVGASQKATGHVSFVPVSREATTENFSVEGAYNRIALMRSSELIVKYLSVPQAAIVNDWAGVFLCSDDSDVRAAFAMAEPPAHDDWIHEGLADRNHKTWVKMTKQRLPEMAMRRFGPAQAVVNPTEEKPPSITEGLDEFSERFLAGDGDAPAQRNPTGGGGGQGRRLSLNPQFVKRHADEHDNIIASFRISKQSGEAVSVRARVDIEGAERDALDEIPQDSRPRIILWRLPSGEVVLGDHCTLSAGGEYLFEVQFRGRYAIKAKCEIIQGA
jgi:hypothetical protein